MQTQAQVAGQACIPQQNGNSLQGSSMGGWRKTWQTDADLSIRRVILENIFRLFQKRKPQVTPEWQQKLPDFVKRLEEQLYRDAASKEEYDNLHTLEQRLQSVAKRLTPKNNQTISHHSQGSSLSVSNMIPTPGIGSNIVPVPGSSSNMIPTPGGSNMIPTPGVGSNMVPTPGGRARIMPVNGGGMMPTPGLASTMIPTPGNLSSMIPTPGAVSNLMPASGHGSIFSTTGLTMVSMPSTTGNPLISQQGMTGMHMLQNSQLASSMALPALGSQMIPTPGLTASQMTANVSAVSGPQLQQPQFGVGSGPHIYRNMNGQTNGFVSNNGQRRTSLGGVNGGVMQLMANGQQLVNGNAMHSSASYLNTTPYGNLQMQSQQRMNLQRQQPMRMQGDGYAMNAADLAGPANLSSTATSGSVAASSLGMNPIALQASKMIPVPGLPTQQQTLQPQSQVQPPQQVQHLQRNNFSSSPLVGRSQQQAAQVSKHTLSQSPVSSNFSGQKQPNAASQTEQQLPFNSGFSVVEQQQMHRQQPAQQKLVDIQQQRTSHPQGSQLELETVNRQGQIHQQLQSSQFPSTLLQQHPQKDSVQFKQQQQQPYSQPQPPQDVISQEQQEDSQQLKDQQFQQSEKLPLLDSQQLQEQLCDSPGTGSQSVPQSQSLNQSALNDPVEVVQAPSRLGAASAGGLASEQLGTTTDQQRMQQYQKQQRWLLFLRHASKCTAPEGQCQTTPHCHMAKQLWSHIAVCCERVCQYSRCTASRTLLHHHQQCREPRCPVCGPVRLIIVQQRAHASQNQQGQGTSAITTQSVAGASGAASSSAGISSFGMSQAIAVPKDEFVLSREAQGQPPTKRAKVEPAATSQQHMQVPQIVTTKLQASLQPAIQSTTILQTMNRPCVGSKSDLQGTVKKEGDGLDTHVARVDSQSRSQSGSTAERPVQPSQIQVKMELGIVQDPVSTNIKSEPHDSGVMTTPSKVKQEPGLTASATTVPSMTSKSGKPKFGGTSLTELFTPEQIKEHIMGLRQWFGQSRAKAEKNQAMEHQMSESACHLCAVEKLTFEPPPIYCTPCGARIKRNALFYTTGLGETRHYFCIPCYNEIRSDMVEMDGQTYPKTRLEKRKNDEETEEAWVQCDKCNLWQHQVCALFNGRRNEGGEAEYTCPQCCMKEMEKGERKPLPPSAVLGARDLPKTFLSDHLEQRLARKLKNERLERARVQGKTFEEIPGAEALVVRVVSSVDKKLEVKQRFMEIFQEEDYPTEFPYKSKVVLLFQRIEGVEVCLFGMYVQEFGTECSQPNQRRVYLSYLDSVKYFRPDVRTVHGEALRTFVYHEILIGYLDYCKKRGFSSCYIWACPPLKGEDYILYCHPEIQKTPKSDKLREWYLTMLRKATTDGIVVEVTNLYDHFFVSAGECKAKVTAARLPYFDGDYWPGAAEDMIVQLQQEAEDGRRLQKKGSKKAAPKRACKLITQAEVSSNASKDLQLMHKLGDSILPMKEDFIMVHMHHACSHCCVFIVTGCRWVCKQCKNFQLCDRCYDVEQKLEEKDRHPVSSKEAHHLIPIEVNDVTPDTKDKDEIMESEFFDTRQAFLSLCQGNHYQYDTLRRAKHSSMMVLYHLHNPTAPAFVTTCNVCHHDIETGQGWRCETCPDFDVCNACYQKDEVKKHPHKLTPHPSAAERNAQNKEARQKRVLQLRKMLDLLVHASQCCAPQCQYPKCRSVKGLFRHGTMCRTRASGGCAMCKRMWHLLQLHARACKESECRVPRCKDLKEHLRRLQQQSESRRRAAVNEMMRQRAAEAAGTAS